MSKTKQYLGNQIEQQLESCRPGHVILLSAPVGSGKTTLIIKRLWTYCSLVGKRLLLLVNRSALRGQLIRAIFEFLDYPANLPIADRSYHEFEGLTLASYQYLEQRFEGHFPNPSVKIGAHWAGDFDYVVADEIHYLFADSQFNRNTDLLWHLPDAFPKAVRVYMSATLAPVRDTLLEIENIHDCFSTVKSAGDRLPLFSGSYRISAKDPVRKYLFPKAFPDIPET